MLKLAKALEANAETFEGVDALAWRKGKEVVSNPVNEIINLEELPSPSLEIGADINGEYVDGSFIKYHQKVFAYRRKPFATLLTARGCPFKCIFCSSPGYLKSIQGGAN